MTHVFIVGSKRSGTTWLLWLLAQHPCVVGFFHSYWFSQLEHLDSWWKMNPPYGKTIITGKPTAYRADEIDGQPNNGYEPHINQIFSHQDLVQWCRNVSDAVVQKVLESKPGATVFVDTQPENLERLEFILGLYPDAYVIHIVRDPRSVFASYRSAAGSWSDPTIFETNVIEFTRRWRLDVEAARQAKDLTSRYHEVRYETVLEDGEKALAEIFSWLRLDFDNALCRQAVENCRIGRMKKHAKIRELESFLRKGSADAWKEELSRSDIRNIEYIAGREIDDLGYDRFTQPNEGKTLRLRVYDAVAGTLRLLRRDIVRDYVVTRLVRKLQRMVKLV